MHISSKLDVFLVHVGLSSILFIIFTAGLLNHGPQDLQSCVFLAFPALPAADYLDPVCLYNLNVETSD